jgi:formylglycine-generating enzyme required for sulfatase activity
MRKAQGLIDGLSKVFGRGDVMLIRFTLRSVGVVAALIALAVFPHSRLAMDCWHFYSGNDFIEQLLGYSGFWGDALWCALILLRLAVRGTKDPWSVRGPFLSYALLFGICATFNLWNIFIDRTAFLALVSLVAISFLLTCAAGFSYLAKSSAAERQRQTGIAIGDKAAVSPAGLSHLRALGFLLVALPIVSFGLEAAVAAAITKLDDRLPEAMTRPEMVKISGGGFMMGCSPGDIDCGELGSDLRSPRFSDSVSRHLVREAEETRHPNGWWLILGAEEPAHYVTVNSFWMDTAPVTQEQFERVIGRNPSRFKGRSRPVESVDWPDARNYCEMVGKRLPTEAEWEYAARGGTAGPRYGKIDDIAWYGPTMGRWGTHPVAKKQPNAYGLYDMLGNVKEWCADWWDDKYYQRSPSDNPQGPERPSFIRKHMYRGAACNEPRERVRASRRNFFNDQLIGFRCARDDSNGAVMVGRKAAPGKGEESAPVAIKIVEIPAGNFQMGSPLEEPERRQGEIQHAVTISRRFFISATEITQGQWTSVMGINPSEYRECGENCPVDRVSWNDAVEFCNRLSDREGLSRCYSGTAKSIVWDRSCAGYRLPTEAEWEYAARAGTTTHFNTGDCLPEDQANYLASFPAAHCPKGNRERPDGPVPVASYPPNAWGLFDMHGNVEEWVWDWWGKYPSGATTDPTGPPNGRLGGGLKGIRGGSDETGADHCRSANRYGNAPETRRSDLGFRIVKSVP